jgi:hypothetical protein
MLLEGMGHTEKLTRILDAVDSGLYDPNSDFITMDDYDEFHT